MIAETDATTGTTSDASDTLKALKSDTSPQKNPTAPTKESAKILGEKYDTVSLRSTILVFKNRQNIG